MSPAEELAMARIGLIAAEAEGQRIDNLTAQALATTAQISAAREVKSQAWEDAGNSTSREYHFTASVDEGSVDRAIEALTRWNRIDSANGDNREYKFVICSGGGAVVYGMKLYSVLKAISAKRPVVTVASGLCASMATIIHQAGSLRVIEPGTSYLIHDVSGESFGTIGSMEDAMAWMSKLNATLHAALAEKSNLTLEEVAQLGKRRDSWHMPDEVLAMGFADVIGYALDATSTMVIPEVINVATLPLKKAAAKPRVRKVSP